MKAIYIINMQLALSSQAANCVEIRGNAQLYLACEVQDKLMIGLPFVLAGSQTFAIGIKFRLLVLLLVAAAHL